MGNKEDDEHDDRVITWFKRWRRPIRQWLSHRSSVPGVDLDDMSQEVFLRVLRYSNDEMVKNPQGYLFRIAANVAHEWAERSRNRNPHLNIDELDEAQEFSQFSQLIDGRDPPEEIQDVDESNYMWAQIQKLPTRQRRVLLAHIRDGKTYKQIADERGLSYRMVLRDLTRAYAQLRHIMERDQL